MSSPKKPSSNSASTNPSLRRTIQRLKGLEAKASKEIEARGKRRGKIDSQKTALYLKIAKLDRQLAEIEATPQPNYQHFQAELSKVLATPQAYGIHTPADRATFDANFL